MYNILTNIIKTYYIDTSQGALDGCTIQPELKRVILFTSQIAIRTALV